MIDIFLDESLDRVDRKLWKVSVGAVEIEHDKVYTSMKQVTELLNDPIRFPDRKKYHASGMNQAENSEIVEVVSKLPISAKVYTYYLFAQNEKVAKVLGMEKSVEHLKYIHRNKDVEIYIEYADEYKRSKISSHLVKQSDAFLVVDSVLSVYTHYLDDIGGGAISLSRRNYTLLKSKIRLQSFFSEKHREYNKRNKCL